MSDVKQFLDKDGLNAFWNKTCSTFIPNRPNTKFYPFIGTASRSKNYKITLPYNGVITSYKLFMMNTMEIVLGSSYQKGATGKIFLSYYFTKQEDNTWSAQDTRAFAIGCNISPTITYQISNPAIFWISLNSTTYNVISIKNLTAEDSVPSYDYRNTTIEAVTDLPTTNISSVPITILSSDDNKLKYNGNEIAIVNHTHDYLPSAGGSLTGPIVFNGTDSNRNIIRINNTTGDGSKYGDFGFTLKYLGAGEGNHNGLGLYADNQSSSTQILAAEWKQDGTLFSRSINPAISDNYTLGKTDYRWNEVHSKKIYADSLYEGSQLLSDKYADKAYADYCSSYLHSANRAQFCKPAGVTIEYSTDSGSTWTDYGATDEQKIGFFSGISQDFKLGKALSTKALASDMLRLTMDATAMDLYTSCKSLLLNISTNGSSNFRVKVEKSMKGSENTFVTHIENQTLTGWSGWNRIPIGAAFGGRNTQTGNIAKLRLTFMSDGAGSSYTSGAHASVLDVEVLGTTYWGFPHTMAKTGHIYSWDVSGNAIFGKNVTANTFIGNLNGNVTGNATSSTKTGDGTNVLYAEKNNEINFGGTATSDTIYFGYRATDSKTIPSKFVFGSSYGSAELLAKTYKKTDGTEVSYNGHTHTFLNGAGVQSSATTRNLTNFPVSKTLFTGGWNTSTGNYATTWGTTLDISYSTWYQRLAFNTAGRIEYFRGINTDNSDKTSATLSKVGDLAYLSDIPTSLPWSSITSKPTFATVATSGSYNDLTDKPTIPTIPSSLPSNGIINAYTTNGITSPAISISGAIRFDTMVCTQYLNNTNKFTGCNNAILSISRFDDDQYTTQLGFSGNGIYARIFSGQTPDTSTSWRTMIMDDGAGNVTANAYYISSDERLKTFGDDIKVDFDELAKLRKSHFVFNDNPTKQEIGVSAQEVQKIYPEIVNETEEGTLSVDYSKLAVVALAAIDKLNQRVQELENKLAKYE